MARATKTILAARKTQLKPASIATAKPVTYVDAVSALNTIMNFVAHAGSIFSVDGVAEAIASSKSSSNEVSQSRTATKSRGGRPKGSKNKSKQQQTESA